MRRVSLAFSCGVALGALIVFAPGLLPLVPLERAEAVDGGACSLVQLLCAAECVDMQCVEQCLGTECAEAQQDFLHCTREAKCEEPECQLAACEEACAAALGAVRPLTGVRPGRCDGSSSPVAPGLRGNWELVAASFQSTSEGTPAARPDYSRQLRFDDEGCFSLQLVLRPQTLGTGNELEVNLHGVAEAASAGRELTLSIRSGEVTGSLCGGRFQTLLPPSRKARFYRVTTVEDQLQLQQSDAPQRVLHFRRVE